MELLGADLYVEEDDLLGDAVVVFGPDDELAPVRDFDAVDDESVVVSDVPLHVLDALPQLHVVVVPRDGGGGEGDDPAGEPGRVQVWSLTQFYSVDFSKSGIGVKKCVFNKRTIKVCVSCG